MLRGRRPRLLQGLGHAHEPQPVRQGAMCCQRRGKAEDFEDTRTWTTLQYITHGTRKAGRPDSGRCMHQALCSMLDRAITNVLSPANANVLHARPMRRGVR